MLIKDKIEQLNKQKNKMINKSSSMETNVGFRQFLKRLDLFNLEIQKLEKELKNNDPHNSKG